MYEYVIDLQQLIKFESYIKINKAKDVQQFLGYTNPKKWSKVVGGKQVYKPEKLELG